MTDTNEDNSGCEPNRRDVFKGIVIAGAVAGGVPVMPVSAGNQPGLTRGVILYGIDLPTRDDHIRSFLDENGLTVDDVRSNEDVYTEEIAGYLADKVVDRYSRLHLDHLPPDEQQTEARAADSQSTSSETAVQLANRGDLLFTKAVGTRPTEGLVPTGSFSPPAISVNSGKDSSISIAGRDVQLPLSRPKRIDLGDERLTISARTYDGRTVEYETIVRGKAVLEPASEGQKHQEVSRDE